MTGHVPQGAREVRGIREAGLSGNRGGGERPPGPGRSAARPGRFPMVQEGLLVLAAISASIFSTDSLILVNWVAKLLMLSTACWRERVSFS